MPREAGAERWAKDLSLNRPTRTCKNKFLPSRSRSGYTKQESIRPLHAGQLSERDKANSCHQQERWVQCHRGADNDCQLKERETKQLRNVQIHVHFTLW